MLEVARAVAAALGWKLGPHRASAAALLRELKSCGDGSGTAGAGTAAHRAASNAACVTISLDLKFIGASKIGDEIIGNVKILKKTKTFIFLFCELKCNNKIITSANGIWKILKTKPSDLGPGG